MGINKGEAEVPREIKKQSLCVDSDIWEFLQSLIPQKWRMFKIAEWNIISVPQNQIFLENAE